MSKYIKLEDAIHNINLEVIGRKEYTGDMKANLFFALDDLPTIDIVHCGECKCCRDELIEEHMPLYIYCEKWNHETDFDGFCKLGERKDNE